MPNMPERVETKEATHNTKSNTQPLYGLLNFFSICHTCYPSVFLCNLTFLNALQINLAT